MDVLSPLLFGHAAAMTLKAAVELNIPDILARADPQRHLSVHEIAAELPSGSVDELSLHRFMRALVHLGVFSADQVESHSSEPLARYGLTPASRMLVRENNPGSLAPMVMYLNYKSSQTPWQHLHETILCGKNPFKVAYGKTSWEYSNIDPEYGELWNAADRVQGSQKIEALKRYDGFKDVKSLVDVGGNKGTTVVAIVAAHPHIRGINFDFPHVVAGAPNVPGVEHVAGNLLENEIPHGDTMLLKNVVHLFNGEDSLKILQNCKKSLTPDGKLLIYDPVTPSEFGGESPYTGVSPMMDIALLVYGGGVDRTEQQWRSLLALAGFPNVKFICLQPQHWLIEAR
ncbi:hypothetical protein M758_5G057500 [Ceratodon purpureus]|nr:hypothetical protein M758_5G057500 [Ceratodon purpureus]KAG0615641.1 hypothetical protein M758_5G057500 [Ceratodon purpureus]